MNSLRLRTSLFCALACSTVGAFAADPLDGWTKLTLSAGSPTAFNDLKYINGKFWAPSGAGKMYSSANLVDWTYVQTPTDQILTGIEYANGVYVASGLRTTLLSSPDGTTWTKRYEHPEEGQWPHRFHEPIFAQGEFIAVGTGGIVHSSANGVEWTPEALIDADFDANGIEFADGLYVAVGDGGAGDNVRTSPDLVVWTERDPDTENDLEDIAYGNGRFVATGWNNTIISSPDGVTWTKHPVTLQYQQRIWGVEFCNGMFVAFGQYGAVLTSPDGTEWTKRTTTMKGDIGAAVYDGANLIIAGNSGGLQKSNPWAPATTQPQNPGDPGDPNAFAQIANISTRAWIGTGDTKLITGFVIHGNNPKKVLIRGVGPTLGGYGVAGTLVDPIITLFDGASQQVATNNDWGAFADQAALATETANVFAFALPAGSKDAAMVVTLQPGSYTLHTAGADGGTGVALAEVYDCVTGQACKLINISSRGFIGTGDNVAIPGFVVAGDKPKKLLVRGVGPTLGNYGVPSVLGNPKVALYDAAQNLVAENDDWHQAADEAGLLAATAQVGAFALNAGSSDAAMVVTVPPGSYTAIVSGLDGATGVALVEIYEVE